MRIASAAKLRTMLVVGSLLLGVATFRSAFPTPVVVGQESGSDLPANWQALNANDFCSMAEGYLLSANPQLSSRQLLLKHAWNAFLATDQGASSLSDSTLDRLLGIVNLKNQESRQIVMDGRSSEEQSALLSRWRDLQTRYTNSTISKLSQSESIVQILDDVQKLRDNYGDVSVSSPLVGQQVGEWAVAHATDVETASSEDLLKLLDLLNGVVPAELGIVLQAWITPPANGTYEFTQLLHGAQEGAMTISVNGQVVFDSAQSGEDQFQSTPIVLTAGQAVKMDVVYGFNRSQLTTIGKLPKDAGTEKCPIFPVAAVLWKVADEDFSLVPDAIVKTTVQGNTPGVLYYQYSDAGRSALQFETTQTGLGDLLDGVKVSLNQWQASETIAGILLDRDLKELIGASIADGSQTTIGTLISALRPTAAAEQIEAWIDRPDILEQLNRQSVSDIASSAYLLPEDCLVDFLVAWSDVRTGYENSLAPEAHFQLLYPTSGETISVSDFQNGAYDAIGAKLSGSHQVLHDHLLPNLVGDDGMARLPLVKIGLAAASANHRLDDVLSVITNELQDLPPSEEKGSWLLAQAYCIEAKEAVSPHPQAVAKLEEVLLVAESDSLRRMALLEALSRLMTSEAKFNQLVGQHGSLLSSEFIATIKPTPPPLPGGPANNDAEMTASQAQVRNAMLQQRLEKARQNGNQALVSKYERMLTQ